MRLHGRFLCFFLPKAAGREAEGYVVRPVTWDRRAMLGRTVRLRLREVQDRLRNDYASAGYNDTKDGGEERVVSVTRSKRMMREDALI